MTNARAEALLEKCGIKFECEPAWILEGQKPDFYCRGRPNFWCEVKTLGRLPDSKDQSDALAELRNRTSGIFLPGYGIAYISSALNHRDAKAVAHLVKRAVRRFQDSDSPQVTIALIPSDGRRDEFVRFSIATKDHAKVEIHSAASLSGMYGVPHDMVPEPYDQLIKLRFSSGVERELSAEEVVKSIEDFRVAVVIFSSDMIFDVVTVMITGGMRRLDNSSRIRDTVGEANDQFKNAIKYKTAPCLLMIFHDGLDVPDDVIIKSALYGNLQFQFPKGSPEKGKWIVNEDGAWNSTKNRTTSAVMYVRNSGEPLIIHNYWADRPLPAGIFLCREVAATNGKFDEVNFPRGLARWIPNLHRCAFRARQKRRAHSARSKS